MTHAMLFTLPVMHEVGGYAKASTVFMKQGPIAFIDDIPYPLRLRTILGGSGLTREAMRKTVYLEKRRTIHTRASIARSVD